MDKKPIEEQKVEKIVREHLGREWKGWQVTKDTNKLKDRGQHGADILLYKKGGGGYMIIEVKGFSRRPAQNYTSFYTLFGQFLSRIDVMPKGHYRYHKKYVLAAPTDFIDFFQGRIYKINKKGMVGGFNVFAKATNLQLWAVDMRKRTVEEKSWREMVES